MFKIKAADGTNNLSGRKIAQIRKERKLSQRKLAQKDYDYETHGKRS